MSEPGPLAVHLAQQAPIPLAATFDCAAGEMLALVGPSGSGKSTILRCIAGLHAASAGHIACGEEVWFDPERAINLTPQARPVGLVFQHYALFPHLSALENVIAALGHRPSDERAGNARALLARVHLEGLEQRRPAQLSGGQQQRVAVARALAREPRVLLLDEPFSAVDRVTRQKLYRELAELRRALAMPIVLVTHDLDEASVLADRMCILHRGRTLQVGAPLDVMTHPADAMVARLVALRNVFEAVVVAHEAARGCTLIDWRGHALEAAYAPTHAVGDRVHWTIPTAGVLLHRRDRPSRGERENPLHGTVVEALVFGEDLAVTLRVESDADARIELRVPAHVAHRNGVALGEPIGVSLLAEAIHLMPWRPDARETPSEAAAV